MLREIGELLYPWPLHCLCCGAATYGEGPLCPECGAKLAEQQTMTGFAGKLFGLSVASHMYAGPAGALVRRLKYNDLSALTLYMAEDMLKSAELAGMPAPDMVTFVPMHWLRRRGKYYNQAELLARVIAGAYSMRAEKAIRRVRACAQQAKISDPDKRRRNVQKAFAACVSPEGRRVMLIDDVYTTGATATECAKALLAAGASRVDLLVYSVAGGAKTDDDGTGEWDGYETMI